MKGIGACQKQGFLGSQQGLSHSQRHSVQPLASCAYLPPTQASPQAGIGGHFGLGFVAGATIGLIGLEAGGGETACGGGFDGSRGATIMDADGSDDAVGLACCAIPGEVAAATGDVACATAVEAADGVARCSFASPPHATKKQPNTSSLFIAPRINRQPDNAARDP